MAIADWNKYSETSGVGKTYFDQGGVDLGADYRFKFD
jgi:hypothetical protein